MKTSFLTILLIGGALTLHAATKPNIVVIYADDMGYGDVRCNNPERGKIPTPNLDRLAAEGMRFTDAHSSSSVCSPSRYTLLTGRYHWRTRLQRGIVGIWDEPLIASDRLTIGGLAKRQGYSTAAFGKWHLGFDWAVNAGEQNLLGYSDLGPARKDNAQVEGTPSPKILAVWEKAFGNPIGGGPIRRGFDTYFGINQGNWPPYCFIENDRAVAMPSVFLPLDMLDENKKLATGPGAAVPGWSFEAILPTLTERSIGYIQQQAEAKQSFLLYFPLVSPHMPVSPTAEWKGKSGLNEYADFVMQTDDAIGQVLAALEHCGIAQNTLVLFTSDNGCSNYSGKPDELEAKGHFPSGPYRGYKSSGWEGGSRMPFLVRWPEVVKPGQVCDQLVSQADLMATLADVFGVKLPDHLGEDSVSLLPLLRGEDRPVREHLITCDVRGTQAVRSGSWKLVCTERPQLFNLADDPQELKNLAAANPGQVKDMLALREKIIADGRSTPGTPQKNDVEVTRETKLRPKKKTGSGVAPTPQKGRGR
jgi:arylsulfatase A-like enzyme